MITILNRKQLVTTFSMEEEARIRHCLSDNHIDYRIKVINRMSPSALSAGTRADFGSFGVTQEQSNEYIFYVKKDDFEQALYFIRK